jgi:hypothetical protein
MHDVAMRRRPAGLVIAALLAMLVVGGVMLFGMGTPADAATGGNSANAAKCEEGGYLDYTDAQGNAFKNAGQCTSYAARGGQLVPVPTGPDISIDQAAGTISGTGFTPNSTIALRGDLTPSSAFFEVSGIPTDATGAFTTGGMDIDIPFCMFPDTSVEVTATDDAGVTVTETIPLNCGT